ncbi:hypothetical protein ACET3X_000438 [Alternaria dauci]|uniref:Uncharacterized protein n=1 Tax=Alternaria dauci TaxID=48095 RepID=A0ABR3UUD4_9PLEO
MWTVWHLGTNRSSSGTQGFIRAGQAVIPCRIRARTIASSRSSPSSIFSYTPVYGTIGQYSRDTKRQWCTTSIRPLVDGNQTNIPGRLWHCRPAINFAHFRTLGKETFTGSPKFLFISAHRQVDTCFGRSTIANPSVAHSTHPISKRGDWTRSLSRFTRSITTSRLAHATALNYPAFLLRIFAEI